MERIDSGNAALDRILGGGYVRNSTNLIMGMPGTGKTVLAQSIVFHTATPERPALFLSTVSEPLDRMLRYVQAVRASSTPTRSDEALLYEDLSETLRAQATCRPAVDQIVALIKEHRPSFLVIDSFKALHSFSTSARRVPHGSLRARRPCSRRSPSPRSSSASTRRTRSPMLPEFAVVDSIVELVLKKTGHRRRALPARHQAARERLRRGRARVPDRRGRPRALPAPRHPGRAHQLRARDRAHRPPASRPSTRCSSTASGRAAPPSSSGRPAAARRCSACTSSSRASSAGRRASSRRMQENPTQLQRIVAGFGWDLQEAIDSGMLTLLYMSPVGTYIDEIVGRVSETALREGSQRVLVDSLNDLAAAPDDARFRDFMYSLAQYLAVNGISAFMTHEIRDLFSTTVFSRYGISHMSDNVVLLSYVRENAEIKRSIAVVKTQGEQPRPGHAPVHHHAGRHRHRRAVRVDAGGGGSTADDRRASPAMPFGSWVRATLARSTRTRRPTCRAARCNACCRTFHQIHIRPGGEARAQAAPQGVPLGRPRPAAGLPAARATPRPAPARCSSTAGAPSTRTGRWSAAPTTAACTRRPASSPTAPRSRRRCGAGASATRRERTASGRRRCSRPSASSARRRPACRARPRGGSRSASPPWPSSCTSCSCRARPVGARRRPVTDRDRIARRRRRQRGTLRRRLTPHGRPAYPVGSRRRRPAGSRPKGGRDGQRALHPRARHGRPASSSHQHLSAG